MLENHHIKWEAKKAKLPNSVFLHNGQSSLLLFISNKELRLNVHI
jgi:hypothetical protein